MTKGNFNLKINASPFAGIFLVKMKTKNEQ
jgi:hypothetical protein